MIGYWLDEAQWGKGYMSEAVCAVLDYGFNKLGLTLISANCYPQNKRSQRVDVYKRQPFNHVHGTKNTEPIDTLTARRFNGSQELRVNKTASIPRLSLIHI